MKTRESELIFLYLLFDLIILNCSIFIMLWINPLFRVSELFTISTYFLHANLSWILTYFILSHKNLYLRDGYVNRVRRITSQTFFFILVALLLAYLIMPRMTYSRIFLGEYTLLFYVGKLIFYYYFYKFLKMRRQKGLHVNRAIIVGLNETSQMLYQIIEFNPILGYKFLGFVSDNDKETTTKVLGKSDELESLILKHQVEIVFVTLSIVHETEKSRDYIRLCSRLGVRLRFVPENQNWFKNRMDLDSVGQLLLINPLEIPLDDLGSQFIKRTFDIVFSFFVVILILSWLIPLLAIIIKLSSKGPVFFVQKRTGMNNKPFNCLKFRSMQVNNEADDKQATLDDSRITAIGSFIRRNNIDELPQFLNVLVGQMSVVGPRPHMLKHTEQYSQLIENYLVRHFVRPGITGWAQVSGYRGETDELWKMEKRVEYDMNYLENWNLWWDIRIVVMTIVGKEVAMNAV